MNTIFWAADSTVQTNYFNTYPQTGIGQVFSLFIKNEYRVENHAKNGRSTKSFMEEGRLKAIEERIGEGDFLFIQFGHNDEKIKDPARYTEPFSTYIQNLETFIGVAKEHGAYPVLITPLERRCFGEDGHLGAGEHGDYVAAMKQTAEKCEVPLVDLYSMSRAALEEAGEVSSRRWYMYFPAGEYAGHPEASLDNTHLRYDGAVNYAAMIADGLRKLGGIYKEMLRGEAEE
ncbi:MAG: rhamnogalacturonan acetylesterase [Bacteroidales bacterium]|nr:rhamnogalacturonan acetylesterase [Lachnoclostridium sp.]MCM1383805.1 rhamnogalacturonan acetylesterase [Lachnoclostridium sp.]MCM1464433.1 rhamnogalacturonan acetylesterase [Bacteroidales bacterium]